MTESIVWIIAFGLAAVITGIYMLSKQIANHLHDTTQIAHHSNEMILAQLERLTGSPVAGTGPTVRVILERRRIQRRNLAASIYKYPGKTEPRKSPGRRLTDFPETATAGYSG